MKQIFEFKTTSEYVEYVKKRNFISVIVSSCISLIGLIIFIILLVYLLKTLNDHVGIMLGIIFSGTIFLTGLTFSLCKLYFLKVFSKAFNKKIILKNDHKDHY